MKRSGTICGALGHVVFLALLALAVPALAQRPAESRPPPPAAELPAEHAAAEEPIVRLVAPVWRFITQLQRQLQIVMPGTAAWAVLAGTPILLPMMIILLNRWVERRRARRAAKKQAQKDAPTAKKRPEGARNGVEKKSPPVTDLAYTPEQKVLLTKDKGCFSLYQTTLGVSLDDETLDEFRRLVKDLLPASAWTASVAAENADGLRQLRGQWATGVCARRLQRWLASHPLVAGHHLCVDVPARFEEVSAESLALVNADGLGVRLNREQDDLLQQARGALHHVLQHTDDPIALAVAERKLGLPILVSRQVGAEVETPLELILLLEGIVGAQHCIAGRLIPHYANEELIDALQQHRELVGTAVPAEGSAIHALHLIQGGNLTGTGTLLAAVAGAAFSPAAVVLRLSKYSGEVQPATLKGAMENLGHLVLTALAAAKSADGQRVVENARRLLGITRLERELQQITQLVRERQRQAGKEPLWPKSREKVQNPDLALLELHQRKLELAWQQGKLALGRLLDIFQRLAYEGDQGQAQRVARGRVGYAVAGLGMPLLLGCSMELLSACREVIAALKAAPPLLEKDQLLF